MNEHLSTTGLAEVTCETQARPFYFISRGQPLLAWLHTPASGPTYNHGVILCASIGHEQVHAYRGMRHLAESLASRGIAVLRFDWFGTGDSAGDDDSPDRMARSLANVRDAVALMKHECGFAQISVIGFRVGGLLAVEGLAGDETVNEAIENLVLWAPVASGRSYGRELQLIASTANSVAVPEPQPSEKRSLQAGGFCYTADTIAALAALNITRQSIRCRNALVVHRDDIAADSRVLKWLTENNVTAEARTLPGVKDMLVEPHFTHVPHEAIAAVSTWLAERIAESSRMQPFDGRAIGVTKANMPFGARLRESTSNVESLGESIWQSAQPNLMGVVTESRHTEKRLPLIVLLNSGAVHRIGVGRLNVLIARRLALLGFRSLRFDFRGLGDSPVYPAHCENDTYPSTGFDDLATVLEAAGKNYGQDRCVLLGLCSGAYFAFQAASQFRETALVESVLINPLTYFWRDGMTIDDPALSEALESHWRFTRRLDVQRIWKFVSGRSKVGFRGAMREVVAKLAQLVVSTTPQPNVHCFENRSDMAGDAASYGHPLEKDLPRDLLQIAKAKRILTLFLAESDPGMTIMNSQARRQAKHLIGQGILSVSRIADADHTFSQSAARNALIERIASHLGRRYL